MCEPEVTALDGKDRVEDIKVALKTSSLIEEEERRLRNTDSARYDDKTSQMITSRHTLSCR